MRDGPTYKLIDALLKEGHPLMIAAARQIAKMREELDDRNWRIYCQRVANRQNWMIVEQRANVMGSKASRAAYARLAKRYKELRALNGPHAS